MKVSTDIDGGTLPEFKGQPAVILNGAKPGLEEVRQEIKRAAQAAGCAEPWFYETTPDDPGGGVAQEALKAGADLLVVGGGDGTIRSVAIRVLGRAETQMALLPLGTGNLLARNMGIDSEDLSSAIHAAFNGPVEPVDALRIDAVHPDKTMTSELSLVATGVGIDAEIMSTTKASLKALIGPAAYLVSALRRVAGFPRKVRLSVDGRAWETLRVRTVLMANAGYIQGGIRFAPGASLSDGVQEAVILRPRTVLGWVVVGVKTLVRPRLNTRLMEHISAHRLSIRPLEPLEAQVDGDAIGKVTTLSSAVIKHALAIRVPEPKNRCAPGGAFASIIPRSIRKGYRLSQR